MHHPVAVPSLPPFLPPSLFSLEPCCTEAAASFRNNTPEHCSRRAAITRESTEEGCRTHIPMYRMRPLRSMPRSVTTSATSLSVNRTPMLSRARSNSRNDTVPLCEFSSEVVDGN